MQMQLHAKESHNITVGYSRLFTPPSRINWADYEALNKNRKNPAFWQGFNNAKKLAKIPVIP